MTTACFANEQENDFKPLTKEEIKTLSEAFGHFIGKTVNTPGVSFDLDSLIKGMRDEAAGRPSPLTDEQTEEMMKRMQVQAISAMADANLEEAETFLQNNKSKPDVREIVPGKLQAAVIKEGRGESVTENDTPVVHFTGTFLSGDTFTSTEQLGKAIPLPLDGTIEGFKKGVPGMKEGEKRRLFIHPDLAYGTSGHLPPNSLLIFEIEVVKANATEEDEAPEGN